MAAVAPKLGRRRGRPGCLLAAVASCRQTPVCCTIVQALEIVGVRSDSQRTGETGPAFSKGIASENGGAGHDDN